ncbi:MAG: sigma-70 family RNA polymerase sigma factor [Bryobacteraceae bacterium]|nr:sigma-70 family RNA polymerase sigma factor [Bryobacteraceae bacterium]
MAEKITLLARQAGAGDRQAQSELFELVYGELRKLAAIHMQRERGGHTLQATALVHEAYLRLFSSNLTSIQDRKHFFAIASRVMRRILVDHSRSRKAGKRGGGAEALALLENQHPITYNFDEVIALDEALSRLEKLDARQCQVVEMRVFGGFSEAEIAEVLDVSERTVKRDWKFAKAWLYGEVAGRQ